MRDLSLNLLVRLTGVALLLIPFLPIRALYPGVRGTNALVSPAEWLLGLAIFGTAAWLLAMALHTGRGARLLDRAVRFLAEKRPARGVVLLAGAALLALLLATAAFVFGGKPRLVDAVVQLFQARIFAAGLLTAPAPPGEGYFAVQHMIVDGNGWYSQYPPGHSLLLAAGVLLSAEWLVPVLLSMATFVLLWALAREIYGQATARLTALLALLCPFFWVMGAGFMNHVSALTFGAAFVYGFARWEASDRPGWLAAAGAALGIAFLSRPLSALAIGAPFALYALARAWRRRNRRTLVAMAVAAMVFLLVASVYLVWNHWTTGAALTTGYVKLWGEGHGLGFHVDPWGEIHTPATGLRNELIDLSLLNVFLFEWPVPALLPLGIFLAVGLARGRWDRRLLLGFVALPLAHFFYWHRDDFLGPRFLYEGLIFLLPLTARAILVTGRWLHGRRLQPLGLFRSFDAASFAAMLLILSLGYAVAFGIPQRFRSHALGWSSMRVDVVSEARAAGLETGVILVATSWGNRLLAELRDYGVRPALAQQVYDEADHCRIQEILIRAREEAWERGELSRRLELLRAAGEELVSPNLNGDPTIKLRPGLPLTPACARAIAYDRSGYTLYLPHLLANDPRLAEGWIVARDLPGENARLLESYPGMPVYRYRPGGFDPLTPAEQTLAGW